MVVTYLNSGDASQLLRGAATPEQKSARILEQFESILVREVLKSAPQPQLDDGKKKGGSKIMGEVYGDLLNDVVASHVSRSGQLGLRESLSRQLSLQLGEPAGRTPSTGGK